MLLKLVHAKTESLSNLNGSRRYRSSRFVSNVKGEPSSSLVKLSGELRDFEELFNMHGGYTRCEIKMPDIVPMRPVIAEKISLFQTPKNTM